MKELLIGTFFAWSKWFMITSHELNHIPKRMQSQQQTKYIQFCAYHILISMYCQGTNNLIQKIQLQLHS